MEDIMKLNRLACILLLSGAVLTGQTLLTSVPIPPSTAKNLSLVANPAKNELYAVGSGYVTVVDTSTTPWSKKRDIGILPYAPSGACANSKGLLVVVTGDYINTSQSEITLVDTSTGAISMFFPAIPIADVGCSFSGDNKVWVTSNLFGSSNMYDKVFLLDVSDPKNLQVSKTWKTGDLYHTAIQAVGNGKAYALTAATNSGSGGLVEVISETSDKVTTIDVGGDPRSIRMGPNGLAYVTVWAPLKVVAIDPATDKITQTSAVNIGTTSFVTWPSPDPWFCYEAQTGGFNGLNLFQGDTTLYNFDTKPRFGIWAQRQSNGTDLVALLGPASLDVYSATQPPMIYAITNCADFKEGSTAPGACATVWGHDLSAKTLAANPIQQLPTTLENTQVTITGQPSPLYFVSPNQVNLQVPMEASGDNVYFALKNGQTTSNSVKVSLQASAPAQFMGLSGETLIDPNTGLWSTPKDKAGQAALIYAVGLGTVNPALKSGQPAPMSPLSKINNPVVVKLCGEVVAPFYAGVAPGWVGLYQLNLWIPAACAGNPTVAVVEAAK